MKGIVHGAFSIHAHMPLHTCVCHRMPVQQGMQPPACPGWADAHERPSCSFPHRAVYPWEDICHALVHMQALPAPDVRAHQPLRYVRYAHLLTQCGGPSAPASNAVLVRATAAQAAWTQLVQQCPVEGVELMWKECVRGAEVVAPLTYLEERQDEYVREEYLEA